MHREISREIPERTPGVISKANPEEIPKGTIGGTREETLRGILDRIRGEEPPEGISGRFPDCRNSKVP